MTAEQMVECLVLNLAAWKELLMAAKMVVRKVGHLASHLADKKVVLMVVCWDAQMAVMMAAMMAVY